MLNNIEKLDLNTLAHVCGGQTTKRYQKKRSGRVVNSTGHSSLLSWIGNICFIGCAAYVIMDLFKRCFGYSYIQCYGYAADVKLANTENGTPSYTRVISLPVYVYEGDVESKDTISSITIYATTPR